jgi:hypothetical protein
MSNKLFLAWGVLVIIIMLAEALQIGVQTIDLHHNQARIEAQARIIAALSRQVATMNKQASR